MKTLITAVMLSVIATAGFADTFGAKIETANKIIPKGKLISTIPDISGFVMTHKGKVYVCRVLAISTYPVGCVVNTNS